MITLPFDALKALPWIGGALMFALGFQLAQRIYAPKAREAELRLELFTSTQEALAARGKLEAEVLRREASAELAAQTSAIHESLTTGLRALQRRIALNNMDLRESINATRYDCLRSEPLPDDYLRMLARPGGAVSP